MLDKPLNPRGPELRDGTAIGELIDREARAVSLRVMHDAEIHRLELEHLWAKAWIIVGHESEIAKAGDFVRRRIGEDKVILVRQKDGSIRGMLNVCPHKGMQVCRTDAGNAQAFQCIYHGWTFNRDGSFRGAPFKSAMYGDALKPEEQGLRPLRVALAAGIIFACWDDDAPSLDNYLGSFRFYFDMIFDRAEGGLEVLGPPQRWVINANWKAIAEQFGGDNYHSATLHRSLAEMKLVPGDPNTPDYWGLNNKKVSTEEGHGCIIFELNAMYEAIASMTKGDTSTSLDKLRMTPPAGIPSSMVDYLADRFSPEELKMLAETPPSVGGLFPNIAIIAFMAPLPDHSLAATYGIHSFMPLGHDKMEYIHWNFVAKNAPQEYREQCLFSSTLNISTSGFVEQDDNEIYGALQESARGFIGQQQSMQYLAISGDNKPEGWLGGGAVHTDFAKDDGQWKWWLRYFDYMTGALQGGK